MYATHAKAIQEHVNSPETFKQCATFVLATIRVPLWSAAACTRSIITADDDAAASFQRVIWGHKRHGIEWLDAHAREYYRAALEAHSSGNEVALMDALLCCPGIGLAKAGFLAQLAFGRVGCLDTHNLRMYNIPKTVCRIDANAKQATRERRIAEYLRACEQLGGVAYLWDAWCEYVARTQPGRYSDAEHVSRLHCDALAVKLR